MGILVSKEEEKNIKLQERINADLRNRVQSSKASETDFAEDVSYTKDLKKTNRFSWLWIVLVVLAVASLAFIFWPA